MKWTTDEFTGKRFGKYEVLCRLAIGGMAEIFLGFARAGPFMGRPVVIKRILNEQREDPNALQMLLDEAKMTATLSHPNVAQVLDLETDDDEVLLVIEFIAGANLEEIVEAYTARGEPVPLGFAISVIREAAQGLGHAHGHKNGKGDSIPIIHRDVTPRNVMVDFDGSIKVLDFGIARAKGSERRTQAGMVRGTTAYMSPEQAIGKDVDTRTDLFSLGTIFHELLTGQRLFYKGNPGQEMAAVYEGEIPLPSKMNRRVPRALDTVVMHVLERKLDKRYQTALELIRDLSLAAGSTAWPKERCAELVRERFANRQKEIEKLVIRIPNRTAGTGESRTIIQRSGNQPSLHDDDASVARTMVGGQPLLGDRRALPVGFATETGTPAPPRQQFHEPTTDPGGRTVNGPRPVTPKPQPETDPVRPGPPSAGLNAASLFDEEFSEERTRILPGSKQALPRVVSEAPTDPSRNAVKPAEVRQLAARNAARPESPSPSRAPLIIAAIVALILGAAGGAYAIRRLQPHSASQPTASIVTLSLTSDRPVTVYFGKKAIGRTPVDAFLPAGRHQLELREDDGKRHALQVVLPDNESEVKMSVTLDSLSPMP